MVFSHYTYNHAIFASCRPVWQVGSFMNSSQSYVYFLKNYTHNLSYLTACPILLQVVEHWLAWMVFTFFFASFLELFIASFVYTFELPTRCHEWFQYLIGSYILLEFNSLLSSSSFFFYACICFSTSATLFTFTFSPSPNFSNPCCAFDTVLDL